MDLHRLIINEVRIILPTILAAKQQQLSVNNKKSDNNNKLEFKIITGIGAGTIRRYLSDFIAKKNLT